MERLSKLVIKKGGKLKFIYESPDGGKTVYRKPFNSSNRELIREDGKNLEVVEIIITDDGNQIIIVNIKR